MTTQAAPHTNPLLIEFLYLDLSTCNRCRGTDGVLEDALALTKPALKSMGLVPEVRKVHVQTEKQAVAEGFVASPTIKVAGRDIHPEILLNNCKECGDLCNCADGVDCRVWRYNDEEFTEPPVGLLVEAIMAAAVGGKETPEAAGVSDKAQANMKKYFAYSEAEADDDDCCDKSTCCGGEHAAA